MAKNIEKTTSGKKGRKPKTATTEAKKGSELFAAESTVVKSTKASKLSAIAKLESQLEQPLSLEKKSTARQTNAVQAKPKVSLDTAKVMAKIGDLAAASPQFLGIGKDAPRLTVKRAFPLVIGMVLLSSLAWPQEWLAWMGPMAGSNGQEEMSAEIAPTELTDSPCGAADTTCATSNEPAVTKTAIMPVTKAKVEAASQAATKAASLRSSGKEKKAALGKASQAPKNKAITAKAKKTPTKAVTANKAKKKEKDKRKDQTKKSLASKSFN